MSQDQSQGLPDVKDNMGVVQGTGQKISTKAACQQTPIFFYSRHFI